jgi:hypothetical protein
VALGGGFPANHLVPHLEAILPEDTVILGSEAVSFRLKVIQDRPKSGEKPLGVSRRLESPHGSLALPRRLMGTFRSIVSTLVLAVLHTQHDFPLCGSITSQLVRNDHPWDVLEPFEQFSKKLLGCIFVASALHEDIQDVAVLINRSPEGVRFAIDLQVHLTQVPRTYYQVDNTEMSSTQKSLPHPGAVSSARHDDCFNALLFHEKNCPSAHLPSSHLCDYTAVGVFDLM